MQTPSVISDSDSYLLHHSDGRSSSSYPVVQLEPMGDRMQAFPLAYQQAALYSQVQTPDANPQTQAGIAQGPFFVRPVPKSQEAPPMKVLNAPYISHTDHVAAKLAFEREKKEKESMQSFFETSMDGYKQVTPEQREQYIQRQQLRYDCQQRGLPEPDPEKDAKDARERERQKTKMLTVPSNIVTKISSEDIIAKGDDVKQVWDNCRPSCAPTMLRVLKPPTFSQQDCIAARRAALALDRDTTTQLKDTLRTNQMIIDDANKSRNQMAIM